MIPFSFNPLGYKEPQGPGTGTPNDPFKIYTVEDLIKMRDDINSSSINRSAHYKLMSDIDLSGLNWESIAAYQGAAFSGTFNGNYKVIKNLSSLSLTVNFYGLFGYISGATIKNLGLEDVNITNSRRNFGSLACQVVGATISNCYCTGNIITEYCATSSAGLINIAANSLIQNCFVNVLYDWNTEANGIVTSMFGGVEIINCYSAGTMHADTLVTGIAPLSDESNIIKNCCCMCSEILSKYGLNSYRISGTRYPQPLPINTIALINNYALDTMLVNGNILQPPTRIYDGINATIQQLRSLAFYRDTLGWDMTNIWQIRDGVGFPTLRGF